MQICSPWCTTWFSVIIWGFEHVHKNSDQKDTLGNLELFKLGSAERGFWGTFVNHSYFDWYETLQDHHIMNMWLDRIFLDLFENISYRNISNIWNELKWFWRVLSNILIMTMCWYSYIWTIYVHWASLFFLKYFWSFKIILTY